MSLNLIKSMDTWVPDSLLKEFSFIGAKTRSQFLFEINKERKSLVFSISDINQDDLMSVRFAEELVSAEGKRLILLIGGQEKGYESNTQDDKRTMIFVLPENTTKVEIVGTKVIPEFPLSVVVLAAMVSGVVLMQKLRKF